MNRKREGNIIPSISKGPSLGYSDNFAKRQMWEEIAQELKGEFKVKLTAGNTLEIHNISIPYKKWEIKISVSDSRPLKFQITFSSLERFEMILSQKDFIDKILNKFNKAGIESGWQEFDRKYLIKSKRPDLVKRVLTQEIQTTLLKHNVYSLSYQADSATGKADLMSVIQRGGGEKDMIFELVEMFKLLIDNLNKSRIIK